MVIVFWIVLGGILGLINYRFHPKALKGGRIGSAVLSALGAYAFGGLTNIIFHFGIFDFTVASILGSLIGSISLFFTSSKLYQASFYLRS